MNQASCLTRILTSGTRIASMETKNCSEVFFGVRQGSRYLYCISNTLSRSQLSWYFSSVSVTLTSMMVSVWCWHRWKIQRSPLKPLRVLVLVLLWCFPIAFSVGSTFSVPYWLKCSSSFHSLSDDLSGIMVLEWVLVSKSPSPRMAATTLDILSCEVLWLIGVSCLGCRVTRPYMLTEIEVICRR